MLQKTCLGLCLLLLAASAEAAAPPVAVSLYMETFCPGCQQLFSKQIYPTWAKLNSTGILAVDIVPYGNAKEKQQGNKWVFTCQHGTKECVGNQIETCAIKLLGRPTLWLPYLHCIEGQLANGSRDIMQVAKDCAENAQPRINFDDISRCSLSDQGNQWQHEMALRTEALNPPHKYVPWVTVNGVHTVNIQYEVENDLLNLVCKTYSGPKPKECTAFDVAASSRCPRNKTDN
ncbi:hypothetical protein BOX15_Mlig011395g1 [Macrostomum lignano]|uniref:Saposin A-type domain-containing protein n=1 Tax=Macrostomum lignano TaxID=282301 RepID=A0A267E4W9_9PLAT|nr:hypothetical protein BOX15_Mlig011395g1 [Macrostomum lignano]